jgi:hypothetical protein
VIKHLQENYHDAIDLQAGWKGGKIDVLLALASNWDSEPMVGNIESVAQKLGVFLSEHKISTMQKPLWYRDYFQWFWRRK